MRTKCISLRLKSLVQISDKAYKAEDFNGNIDYIPVSQVYGVDFDVKKSDAYWVSEWILKKKKLTYTQKKEAWFNESGDRLPTYTVEHHIPEKKEKVSENKIQELKK